MFIKPVNILVIGDKPIALRLVECTKDTYYHYDISLDALGQTNLQNLRYAKKQELQKVKLNGEDMYVTSDEVKYNCIVPDISNNAEKIKQVKTFLFCDKDEQFIHDLAIEIFNRMVGFKINGKGFTVKHKRESSNDLGTAINATVKSNIKFNWNEDHSYCELHYNSYTVIDNCSKFDLWTELGYKLEDEYSEKTGLVVSINQHGSKYEIYLDVNVSKYILS